MERRSVNRTAEGEAFMPSESQTTDVWLGVLGSIRGKVTAQQFETWFSGIQPGDCTEDTLELTVANQF